jgi:hypothetical protein
MLFEAIAIITAGAGHLAGNAILKGKKAKWAKEHYDTWLLHSQGDYGPPPPPSLDDPWWKEAVRYDKGGTGSNFDLSYFRKCRRAYEAAHE